MTWQTIATINGNRMKAKIARVVPPGGSAKVHVDSRGFDAKRFQGVPPPPNKLGSKPAISSRICPLTYVPATLPALASPATWSYTNSRDRIIRFPSIRPLLLRSKDLATCLSPNDTMPLNMRKPKIDHSFLEAALVGFGHKLAELTLKIAEIKRTLGIGEAASATPAGGRRRRMSAAGKARIAAAQRKRWAAVKMQQGQATPAKRTAPKKRTMSAAARKRIGEATRKRWAQYRAKQGSVEGEA